MMGRMDLEGVARELYALPPAEFTAARNARSTRARADGDRELAEAVKRLRKPSVGAWVLDLLVREHPEEVVPVVELGSRLRAAMGVLGADDLRALDRQRRELTRSVARRAVERAATAGVRANPQAAADVEESLRTAMVDERAGAALLTGLLTETITTTGLDPVDVARVLAVPGLVAPALASVPSSGGGGTEGGGDEGEEDVAARRRAAVAAARAALRESSDARSAAEEGAAAAARGATRARTARLELEARVDRLRRDLAAAEAALVAAVVDEEAADSRVEAADATAQEARTAEATARSRLDSALGG